MELIPNTFELFSPPESVYELVVEFEVTGQPARKSNSRRIVFNKKTGKPRIIKSDAALSYSDEFLKAVPEEAKLKIGSADEPLLMLAVIYYKSYRPDVSVELIKDLLEEAGVIKNDRWIRTELVFGEIDRENPRTLIRIYRKRAVANKLGRAVKDIQRIFTKDKRLKEGR